MNNIEEVSRCCGRCDGVNDLCVADMMCYDHKILGCEICYGKRTKTVTIIENMNTKNICKSLISLTIEEAKLMCKANDITLRISKKDGLSYVLTCDYHIDRVNVEINNNLITKCNVG